jgi:hypothetical protein
MKIWGVFYTNSEDFTLGLKALNGLGFSKTQPMEPLDLITEAFGKKVSFPLLLSADHVRKFWSKLSLPPRATQSYVGKTITDMAHAIEFFLQITRKAHGPTVFAEFFYDNFKEKEDVVLLTITKEEAVYLSKKYPKNFVSIAFCRGDFKGADVVIEPQKSISAMKRVTALQLSLIVTKEKESA